MGKAESHYHLGLDYYHGNGIPQDTDLAIDYLIKASELDHLEAKTLCAELLFKQAKNTKSIYYEDGYRLGTEYMVDLYRNGIIDKTLPYLLDNDLFNSLCTLEELQEYYQEAYRLGYRETKYELAKILYKNGSYHSSEQLFIDSIKEDISKEAHLYLYYIYNTKECYNEKKALAQFKEAIKYGFISDDYNEFVEKNQQVLMKKSVYESGFSIDKIKKQVASIPGHCHYADEAFQKWLTEDKILVRIYFDLDVKLLNASYDYTHSDIVVEDVIYESDESIESASDEKLSTEVEKETVVLSTKESGFYLSSEIDLYNEYEFKTIFNQFGIKDKNPKINTSINPKQLELSIEKYIRNDIKNKHRDKSKNIVITVKKFNVFKSLSPTFDFKFTYNHEEFISKRYAFDSPEWEKIFKSEDDEVDYKAIKLDIVFPLNDHMDLELEHIQKEVPAFKKRAIYTIPLKIIAVSIFMWSLMIFIQNVFFNEGLYFKTYSFPKHLLESILWYLTGMIAIVLIYYVSRVKIYDPPMADLKQRIIEEPEFVLPQKTNDKHFKKQYIQMLITVLVAIILFLTSGFLIIF